MKTHRLCFAGTILAIASEGEGPDRIIDFLFSDIPRTDLDPPHVTFRLIEEDETGEFRLYRENELERRTQSQTAMIAYLLDRTVYHLANHSRTGLVFHGAALAWKGRGILLPGRSGSGKTTLAAWLLTHGFDYLTDEMTFIPLDTTQLQGLARPLNVKKGSQGVLKEMLDADVLPKEMVSDGTRTIAPPRAFGPCQVLHSVPLQLMLFPRFSLQEDFEFNEQSKGENALHLMECLINARNLPGHGFSEVVRLARTIPAYSAKYGRIDQVGDAIIKTMNTIVERGEVDPTVRTA